MAELDLISLPATDWGPMEQFRFYATHAEYDLRTFKPDVLAKNIDEQELAIEIRVTHEVDDEKRERIKARELDCIEYDLRKIDREIDYHKLVASFRDNIFPCTWIYHHGVQLWRNEHSRRLQEWEDEKKRAAEEKQAREEARLAEQKRALAAALEGNRRATWRDKMPWAYD